MSYTYTCQQALALALALAHFFFYHSFFCGLLAPFYTPPFQTQQGYVSPSEALRIAACPECDINALYVQLTYSLGILENL